MNKKETLQFINGGLSTLWTRDNRLIVRRAKEEAINHRLARYLEDGLISKGVAELDVDVEYNSDGEGKKKIRIKKRYRNVRPDVIFHRRETNERNFLAIELKIDRTTSHDRDKLIGLMQPPYNYKYGAAISCLPKHNYFRVIFFYSYLNYIWEKEYLFQK